MKITRDVILDLLPLYLADEVSEDTRVLVEQYLSDDPALAKLVEQADNQQWYRDVPAPINKEDEMKSFEKTKQLLTQQKMLMGFAIFFTLLIVAVRGGAEGIRWLWHDLPVVGWLLMFVAFVFWAAYFNITARLTK